MICLASTPKIYNIYIDRIFENGIVSPTKFLRDSLVLLYTDPEYSDGGYKPGNIHNIRVSNVVASGARYAFHIWKAQTKDVHCSNIRQLNNNPYMKKQLYKIDVKGKSENLVINGKKHK